MKPDLTDPRIVARLDRAQLTRSLQMLMGLVTGITADGELNDQEITLLRLWLQQHPELAGTWPGDAIWSWMEDALRDGCVSASDRDLLLRNLSGLVANDFTDTGSIAPEVSNLPLDDDADFDYSGSIVVLTGTFSYGTRAQCEALAQRAGCVPAGNVTRKTNLVVIGGNVTSSWITESFGRKIQAAMDLKASGLPLNIISEKRWIGDLAHLVQQP